MDRKEVREALRRAEELVESKKRHAHYHIGNLLLTCAVRLIHDEDFRGAGMALRALFGMAWAEDPPCRAVAPGVMVWSGGNR